MPDARAYTTATHKSPAHKVSQINRIRYPTSSGISKLIKALASTNVIQRPETKIDALKDTIYTKYTTLIWTAGFAARVISMLIIIEMFVLMS